MDRKQLAQDRDVCSTFAHLLVLGKAVKAAARSGRHSASLAISISLGYNLSST